MRVAADRSGFCIPTHISRENMKACCVRSRIAGYECMGTSLIPGTDSFRNRLVNPVTSVSISMDRAVRLVSIILAGYSPSTHCGFRVSMMGRVIPRVLGTMGSWMRDRTPSGSFVSIEKLWRYGNGYLVILDQLSRPDFCLLLA